MRLLYPRVFPATALASVLAVFAWVDVVSPLAAHAQPQPRKSAPTPVAPGDLSKPVFDTTTPVYDSAAIITRGANTVIAEVEGRPITLGDASDVIQQLPPALARLSLEALYPGIMEQLIKQQAIVVRARQQGADEDPVISRRMKAAADRVLANEYLHREISKGITEAALLDRYDQEIAGRPGPEEVRVRVIMTNTEKEAADLIGELRAGADFAAVARRSSKDPTARIGGDLGFASRDGLSAEIGAVAFVLPPGQLTQFPVRGAGSWFVVKVEERRRQPAPGFVAVRDQLVQGFLRDGVIPLTSLAMSEVNVREYNLTGKEVSGEKPSIR